MLETENSLVGSVPSILRYFGKHRLHGYLNLEVMAVSTFSPVGSQSSNSLRMRVFVCILWHSTEWNMWICQRGANFKFILHTCTHPQTIWRQWTVRVKGGYCPPSNVPMLHKMLSVTTVTMYGCLYLASSSSGPSMKISIFQWCLVRSQPFIGINRFLAIFMYLLEKMAYCQPSGRNLFRPIAMTTKTGSWFSVLPFAILICCVEGYCQFCMQVNIRETSNAFRNWCRQWTYTGLVQCHPSGLTTNHKSQTCYRWSILGSKRPKDQVVYILQPHCAIFCHRPLLASAFCMQNVFKNTRSKRKEYFLQVLEISHESAKCFGISFFFFFQIGHTRCGNCPQKHIFAAVKLTVRKTNWWGKKEYQL